MSALPGERNEIVPLARALDGAPRLVLRQRARFAEALVGWEAANRYALHLDDGALAGIAAERAEGGRRLAARLFLRQGRPFEMEIFEADAPHAVALRLRRPWTWFFSRLHVSDGEGRPLGTVRQRFSWRRRLDVEAPGGRVLASLVGPLLHPWTFRALAGPRGGEREVGRIEKRWSGLGREAFTTADTFLVTLPSGDPTLRRLLVAAAILVDFCWFESRD